MENQLGDSISTAYMKGMVLIEVYEDNTYLSAVTRVNQAGGIYNSNSVFVRQSGSGKDKARIALRYMEADSRRYKFPPSRRDIKLSAAHKV